MIWGKTKEERDAQILAWEQWHEEYLWFPRKLEDTHEWAWLTPVWVRWQWVDSYIDGGSWIAHRMKTLPPLGPNVISKKEKLLATCVVCEEGAWPMCMGCRKAILAFKAITE